MVLVSRRLVLKDSVSPDDIELLAESLHWRLEGYVKKDPVENIDFSATWRVDELTEAHFTEDGYAQERYFVVSGAERSRIAEVMTCIQAGIAVWNLEELMLEVDGNIYPASKAKAVLRLGLGAPLEPVDSVRNRILAASANQAQRRLRRLSRMRSMPQRASD